MTDDDSQKLAATLFGLIGVFGYGLLTFIAIREEFIHDVDRQEI